MADAQSALLRALNSRAGGHALVVTNARSERWASATFNGARHSFDLAISGPDWIRQTRRLTETLHAIEFNLPGHLVADISITRSRIDGTGAQLAIEALTVESG